MVHVAPVTPWYAPLPPRRPRGGPAFGARGVKGWTPRLLERGFQRWCRGVAAARASRPVWIGELALWHEIVEAPPVPGCHMSARLCRRARETSAVVMSDWMPSHCHIAIGSVTTPDDSGPGSWEQRHRRAPLSGVVGADTVLGQTLGCVRRRGPSRRAFVCSSLCEADCACSSGGARDALVVRSVKPEFRRPLRRCRSGHQPLGVNQSTTTTSGLPFSTT